VYIIVVKHKQPTENTIMKNPFGKKNRIDELEKEINLLKERVAKIEASFKVRDKEEEKPKTSFM